VRRPSRTRSGFGMVIWPFSETTVFIPGLYEFLPRLSNLRGTACRPRIATGPSEGGQALPLHGMVEGRSPLAES
jgi:hypothetical protein